MNNADKTEHTEAKIDKTLYRVTAIYKGEIQLAKTVEDIIITQLLKDDSND